MVSIDSALDIVKKALLVKWEANANEIKPEAKQQSQNHRGCINMPNVFLLQLYYLYAYIAQNE
jgi:hypothetical protein